MENDGDLKPHIPIKIKNDGDLKPHILLKIVSNVSRFKPALNLNRVLADFGGFKPRLKFFKFHLCSISETYLFYEK